MFNLVKGTHDIILNEADKYTYVEQTLIQFAEFYNFKEFRTPIIESSDLFQRSVGDSSDIVRKEMYTFLDKGDRSITLRPEITAGIIRSIVNNKILALGDYPVKAYYVGPCFRYERPQQGRYRQFNQFGIEIAGVTSPYRDVEAISFGYFALKLLGFENLKLKINSLGDDESRKNYREALNKYFASYVDQMCDDCKERYKLNVLRILDCKVKEDQEIIKNAPKISDYLTDKSKDYFQKVLNSLDELGIEYEIDDGLVRGLDYYSDVVFEFYYTSSKGLSYGALGAGGHYNKLIGEIGGPKDCEGCGLAMGIERLVSVMEDDGLFSNIDDGIDCYIMPLSQEFQPNALNISSLLRLNGFKSEVSLEGKSLKAMFKKALKLNAKFALIIGEDEIKTNSIICKNLSNQEQESILIEDLVRYLDSQIDAAEEHHHECCCHDHNESDKDCCCRAHDDEGKHCCHNQNEDHECCKEKKGN